MAKRKTIDPVYFFILHELLFEKCFGDRAAELANRPDYKVYGYNKALKEARMLKESIKGIIETSDAALNIDGRALSEAAKQYPGKINPLSDDLIVHCLNYLGFDTLEAMKTAYFNQRNILTFEVPAYLKYGPVAKRVKPPGSKARIDEKLENLEHTMWYCYSHFPFHEEAGEYVPAVLRLQCRITSRLPNGDYQIELDNQEPYTSFSGRIVRNFSGDNVLVCELTSVKKTVGKRLYMVIHVDLDASKNLFVGGFLRYKDSGAVYCGSFVMERIEKGVSNPEPDFFHYNGKETPEIKNVIMEYLYDRHFNIVKIPPNIYSLPDFTKWLHKKQGKDGRMPPQYDLFIAAPIRGYQYPVVSIEMLRTELVSGVSKFISTPSKTLQPQIQDMVDVILKKHLSGAHPGTEQKVFDKMQDDIRRMMANLQNRNIGFDRIWYAPAEENFNLNNKIDASTLLSQQLDRFNSSRSFMMILPEPVVSSVFLEAGWAMLTNRNIPVYILCRHRRDLPFLLRKADTLKRRRIFITTFDEIGGIEGIPDWIVDNQYYKYLEMIR